MRTRFRCGQGWLVRHWRTIARLEPLARQACAGSNWLQNSLERRSQAEPDEQRGCRKDRERVDDGAGLTQQQLAKAHAKWLQRLAILEEVYRRNGDTVTAVSREPDGRANKLLNVP